MRKKISVLVMACVVFLTTLTLSFGNDQNGVLSFSTGLSAQTTPPPTSPAPSCFVRTISNCPVIAGQNGGQRVTCDLSGTYVANSTCTPVICTVGTGTTIKCTLPA